MLTEQQFAVLRSELGSNRVAKAMALAGVTQVTLATALRLTQPYVSDVARGRHRTITVENTWSSPPISVAVSRTCSRHPADRRIESRTHPRGGQRRCTTMG